MASWYILGKHRAISFKLKPLDKIQQYIIKRFFTSPWLHIQIPGKMETFHALVWFGVVWQWSISPKSLLIMVGLQTWCNRLCQWRKSGLCIAWMEWENPEIHSKIIVHVHRVYNIASGCDSVRQCPSNWHYLCWQAKMLGKENTQGSVNIHHYSLLDICESIQPLYAALNRYINMSCTSPVTLINSMVMVVVMIVSMRTVLMIKSDKINFLQLSFLTTTQRR